MSTASIKEVFGPIDDWLPVGYIHSAGMGEIWPPVTNRAVGLRLHDYMKMVVVSEVQGASPAGVFCAHGGG